MGQTHANFAGDSNTNGKVDDLNANPTGPGLGETKSKRKTKTIQQTIDASTKRAAHNHSQPTENNSFRKPVGLAQPKPRKLPPLDLVADSRNIPVESAYTYSTDGNRVKRKNGNKSENNYT
jgi:hypothetical protein